MKTRTLSMRFLGTWVAIFGTLFLLAGAALQFWALANPDLRERLIAHTVTLTIGGGTLAALGSACYQIARLEDRVKELERQREPAANGGRG